MNQRARSSAAWLRRPAVWGLSTPSRCRWMASAGEGRAPLTWPSAAVTKLTRSTTVLDEIQDSLIGHPLTSGGSKRLWPMPDPELAMTLDSDDAPNARAAPTMNSVGDFTSPR